MTFLIVPLIHLDYMPMIPVCLIVHRDSLQNLELNCNEALKHVSVWMKVNKLTVNTSKSQVIVLSPKSSNSTPHFNVMMNQGKISCCSNFCNELSNCISDSSVTY